MSACERFGHDFCTLTPASMLIVALTPAAAFALGLIVVFPQHFWA